MDWFWTWEGKCFGYRVDDHLFTYRGKQAGRFEGKAVYGHDGMYLGEILNDNRLITHKAKKREQRSSFAPVQGSSYAKYADYAGFVMYVGYEDFPLPESFR